MTGNDGLHEKADELARDIEAAIESSRAFRDQLPEFEPRSKNQQMLQRTVNWGMT